MFTINTRYMNDLKKTTENSKSFTYFLYSPHFFNLSVIFWFCFCLAVQQFDCVRECTCVRVYMCVYACMCIQIQSTNATVCWCLEITFVYLETFMSLFGVCVAVKWGRCQMKILSTTFFLFISTKQPLNRQTLYIG